MLQNKLNEIERMFASGELATAETAIREVLQQQPSHPVALHMLGVVAHQTGKTEESINIISKVVEANPDYVEALFNLGNILREQERFEEAVERYRAVILLRPTDVITRSTLGLVYCELGKIEEAIETYRHVVAANPHDADAQLNLANFYFKAERYGEAVATYQIAISCNPEFAAAHFNFAICLETVDKFLEAVSCYREVVRLEPGNLYAQARLGGVLYETGQMDAAIDVFYKLLAIDPNNADIHVHLGNAQNAVGRATEAQENFRQAIKLVPDHFHAHYYLHGCLYSEDNMDAAADCLENIVDHEFSETKVNYFLGLIRSFQGNHEAANAQLEVFVNSEDETPHHLDSWKYMTSIKGETPKLLGSTHEMLKLGMNAAKNRGLVLEFGVRFGASVRQIFELSAQDVHGFDTFEGLPDDWHGWDKGSYSTGGEIPEVPEGIHLHAGLFDDTLPPFLNQFADPVRFMNVDCDLYNSTKNIFDHLIERIIPGTVIVFDEYISQPHWREDEYKAFQEAVSLNNWRYDYLAFSPLTKQAVVIIR